MSYTESLGDILEQLALHCQLHCAPGAIEIDLTLPKSVLDHYLRQLRPKEVVSPTSTAEVTHVNKVCFSGLTFNLKATESEGVNMTKFKIGETTTRDGHKARIYALDGKNGEIHGAIYFHDKGWRTYFWHSLGNFFPAPRVDEYDILPNAYPERHEITCTWGQLSSGVTYPIGPERQFDWYKLAGKKTKLTIEVVE